jgi:hypothetical protein
VLGDTRRRGPPEQQQLAQGLAVDLELRLRDAAELQRRLGELGEHARVVAGVAELDVTGEAHLDLRAPALHAAELEAGGIERIEQARAAVVAVAHREQRAQGARERRRRARQRHLDRNGAVAAGHLAAGAAAVLRRDEEDPHPFRHRRRLGRGLGAGRRGRRGLRGGVAAGDAEQQRQPEQATGEAAAPERHCPAQTATGALIPGCGS